MPTRPPLHSRPPRRRPRLARRGLARGALLALALLALAAPAAMAQPSEAVADARAAAQALDAAAGQLDAALSAEDQIAALTAMIRGYEQGMMALRDGLRRTGSREAEIRRGFDARHADLSGLLASMATLERNPETTLLLHPAGALATARAGMVLTDIAPALRAEAETIRISLDEIATMRAAQQDAAETVARGLADVQEARHLLATAMSDRTDLPTRFLENPSELDALVQAARSLEEFADGMAGLDADVGPPLSDFEAAAGALPMPVIGRVLRDFDQPDAAGVRRPGLLIATTPSALVTAPWTSSIRYRGPLADYDNVMIIEPAKGYLIILAGLDQVFGEVGDVVMADDPLGMMPGIEGRGAEFGADFVLSAATGGDGTRMQMLYLELRQGKQSLDPADWFAPNPVMMQGMVGAAVAGDETQPDGPAGD